MRAGIEDPAFRRRLAKLVAMLSADNPAEAEAARQKLRAHLASRQLSMLDLAQRLAAGPEASGTAARVRGLEEALRRSRAEALAALQRATRAERALGRQRPGRPRHAAAGWAATAALAVLAAGAGAAGWTWLHRSVLTGPMPTASAPLSDRSAPPIASVSPPGVAADRPVFSWQPERDPDPAATPAAQAAARPAFVRAGGAALRESAAEGAALRALLPRGSAVTVIRTEHRGGEDWSLVQTEKGQGYVAAAAITGAAP